MALREILHSLLEYMPTKQDTKYSKMVKAASAIDLIKKEYDEYNFKQMYGKYKESFNEILYSCLADDAVLSKTKIDTIKIKDYDYDNNFMHFCDVPNVGKYFFKTRGFAPERDKHYCYYYDKKVNYSEVGKLLYKKYGNKIFLDEKTYTKRKYDYQEYIFESMKMDDTIFEFEKHKKATKMLDDKGIYLFYGKPGTGKSSFIYSESFKDKKCIVMLASMFCDLKQNELDTLMKVFEPDLLLVEEFDKASNKLDSTLLFFEKIKNQKITIVLTANKINGFDPSILRPKRIDKIIKFDVPNKEEITTLVNFYSKNASDENKNKLIELLEKSKFSHAYVVDLSKKLTDDFSETETYIKFLKVISKNED